MKFLFTYSVASRFGNAYGHCEVVLPLDRPRSVDIASVERAMSEKHEGQAVILNVIPLAEEA